MRIVIAGGSGFLGSALARALRTDGADVVILTRSVHAEGQVAWDPSDTRGAWVKAIDGADAIVNLAGETLASGRWTAQRKTRILTSRVTATDSLVAALDRTARPPAAFVNASAIGYYGNSGDAVRTEADPPGDDFLASVCVAWEAAASAASVRCRVVLLRTGLVLARDEGALPRLVLPFRLCAGGPIGSGRQWWSWIHVDDWVAIVRSAIGQSSWQGPFNLTAPSPVTNRVFARTVGRILRRPSHLRTPGIVLRVMLGEMGEALILSGQRVLPRRALAAGFVFTFGDLESALSDLINRRSR